MTAEVSRLISNANYLITLSMVMKQYDDCVNITATCYKCTEYVHSNTGRTIENNYLISVTDNLLMTNAQIYKDFKVNP